MPPIMPTAVGSSKRPRAQTGTDVARQAAPSTATVLPMGESGTGKELFAGHSSLPKNRESIYCCQPWCTAGQHY